MAAPKLYVAAVYQLPRPNDGFVMAGACDLSRRGKMAVGADDIRAVLVHLGGCDPGDESHSLMRAPVSACLARRISSSRLIPGGNALKSVPSADCRRIGGMDACVAVCEACADSCQKMAA